MSLTCLSIKSAFNTEQDKHIYAIDGLPLVTIYDDNWFVRNDYDVLSQGQRVYLLQFFIRQGFAQVTGRELNKASTKVVFPRPNRLLAQPQFEPNWLSPKDDIVIPVTPTAFAEALFHRMVDKQSNALDELFALIDKCPFNIELLRDISYRTPIEQITKSTFDELTRYQQAVIKDKFKRKKAL